MPGDLAGLIESSFGRSRHLLVGRGATALALALRALGLEGRDVLVPASVCYAVPRAVELAGCRPVFVDADPATGNATVDLVREAAADASPGALVALSGLYGAPPPLEALAAWCDETGAVLVEDASLSAGAVVDGRPAGSWGAVSFVSTGGGKVVDAGGGGLVLTDDPALAAELERAAATLPPHTAAIDDALAQIAAAYRDLHWLGRRLPRTASLQRALFAEYGEAFLFSSPAGAESRLADELAELPARLERRAEVAAAYREELPGLPSLTPAGASALWRYSLLVVRRDDALRALWAAGEDASAWYPSCDRVFGERRAPLPGADRIEREVVNLWLDGRDEAAARRTARVLAEALA